MTRHALTGIPRTPSSGAGSSFSRLDWSDNEDLRLLVDVLRVGSTIDDPARLSAHFGSWFSRQRAYDRFVSVSRRDMPPGAYKITRHRVWEEAGAVAIEPENPWRDWDSLETHRGGFIGEVIASEEPQVLIDLDLADDPVLGDAMSHMRACVVLPTYDRGEAINWSFFFSGDPTPWTDAELMQALVDGNLLGSVTRGLVTRRQVDELNRRLRGQLEQIATIQRSLLPARMPRIPGLDIATSYLTSEQVGGDYYDFFPFPQEPGREAPEQRRWGIMIADVAGHGAGAATVMAMLRAILHCYDTERPTPSGVLSFTNAKLLASNLAGSFVTAFFAVFDPVTSELRWSRAGHTPPRLKRRVDGAVVVLDGEGGLPLGVSEDPLLGEEAIVLDPGDTVVLYTDGITEAFNAEREQFGPERFDVALESCSGEPECVVDSIHGALYRHTGSMRREDDQTLVVLRRTV